MTEHQRRIVAMGIEPSGVTGARDKSSMLYIKTSPMTPSLSEAARVPMYSTSMCLRLLYLVPLIGITGTSYALADPITPLHVNRTKSKKSACPENFEKLRKTRSQTEVATRSEEPPVI